MDEALTDSYRVSVGDYYLSYYFCIYMYLHYCYHHYFKGLLGNNASDTSSEEICILRTHYDQHESTMLLIITGIVLIVYFRFTLSKTP